MCALAYLVSPRRLEPQSSNLRKRFRFSECDFGSSPTSVVSLDAFATESRSEKFQRGLVKTPSDDSTISELIGVIHQQHNKIHLLAQQLSKLTLEIEELDLQMVSFHTLLHRGSEAAHALWKKNEKKERKLAKLEETLHALKHRQNLAEDVTTPVAHRKQAEELRPHLWLMTFSKK